MFEVVRRDAGGGANSGELDYSGNNHFKDEGLAFGASREMEPASPGQGTALNRVEQSYSARGFDRVVSEIRSLGNSSILERGPINVPPNLPPTYYRPPQ